MGGGNKTHLTESPYSSSFHFFFSGLADFSGFSDTAGFRDSPSLLLGCGLETLRAGGRAASSVPLAVVPLALVDLKPKHIFLGFSF